MSMRRIESFLLRIVVSEDATHDHPRWRGRIQHVTSGAEQQIDELAEAIAFIATHLSSLAELEQGEKPEEAA